MFGGQVPAAAYVTGVECALRVMPQPPRQCLWCAFELLGNPLVRVAPVHRLLQVATLLPDCGGHRLIGNVLDTVNQGQEVAEGGVSRKERCRRAQPGCHAAAHNAHDVARRDLLGGPASGGQRPANHPAKSLPASGAPLPQIPGAPTRRSFGRAHRLAWSICRRRLRGILRVLVQTLFQLADSLPQLFIHLQQRQHELQHTRWCRCPFCGWNFRRKLNFTHERIHTNSYASSVLS